MEWHLDQSNPRTCEDCAASFHRLNKEPPCRTCSKVALLPDNWPIYEVLKVIFTQPIIGGMGGLIGYNLSLLPFLFETVGIPEEHRDVYLEKIVGALNFAVKYTNEKAAAK